MAIYRNVSMNFWTDTKISDDFSPEDKYFMLYCLTNPYTNLCGCYEISIKQIARDTGYNQETVEKLLERFTNKYKVIEYDFNNKELLIMNWNKYNWTKSEKLDKPLLEEIKNIKTLKFQHYLGNIYNKRDTVSIGYAYTMDTTVSVSVTDTVSVSDNNTEKKQKKIFIKPTLEDVEKYCKERKNNVNAEHFIDYYNSNGWKVGKNAMKDWKATIRNWEKNNFNSAKKTNNIGNFEQREYNNYNQFYDNL